MREIMIYDPGEKVRYIGEKEIKISIPVEPAYIAGRMSSSTFSRGFAELTAVIQPNTTGMVVPNPDGEESTSFCFVKFESRFVFSYVTVPIMYEDLEIV